MAKAEAPAAHTGSSSPIKVGEVRSSSSTYKIRRERSAILKRAHSIIEQQLAIIQEAKAREDERQKQNAALQAERELLRQEYTVVKESFEEFQAEIRERLPTISSRLADLSTRLSAIESDSRALGERINDTQEDLKRALDGFSGRVGALEQAQITLIGQLGKIPTAKLPDPLPANVRSAAVVPASENTGNPAPHSPMPGVSPPTANNDSPLLNTDKSTPIQNKANHGRPVVSFAAHEVRPSIGTGHSAVDKCREGLAQLSSQPVAKSLRSSAKRKAVDISMTTSVIGSSVLADAKLPAQADEPIGSEIRTDSSQRKRHMPSRKIFTGNSFNTTN